MKEEACMKEAVMAGLKSRSNWPSYRFYLESLPLPILLAFSLPMENCSAWLAFTENLINDTFIQNASIVNTYEINIWINIFYQNHWIKKWLKSRWDQLLCMVQCSSFILSSNVSFPFPFSSRFSSTMAWATMIATLRSASGSRMWFCPRPDTLASPLPLEDWLVRQAKTYR